MLRSGCPGCWGGLVGGCGPGCLSRCGGEWDARAALLWLGESLAVVGVAVAGFVSGGSGWDGWMAMEWMGFGCEFAGMAWGALGRWQADEPESLILAQSERWRHA